MGLEMRQTLRMTVGEWWFKKGLALEGVTDLRDRGGADVSFPADPRLRHHPVMSCGCGG